MDRDKNYFNALMKAIHPPLRHDAVAGKLIIYGFVIKAELCYFSSSIITGLVTFAEE